MFKQRLHEIECFSSDGNTGELKKIFELDFTQLEIDVALANAIAYSKIDTAKYLLLMGAQFSNYDYQGVYYAVHNNELEGVKFAISQGVDINVNSGMLLNASVETVINQKQSKIMEWLLNNGADSNLLTKESLELLDKHGTEHLKNLVKNFP